MSSRCNTHSYIYINCAKFNCDFFLWEFLWWNNVCNVSLVILWKCSVSKSWCNECLWTKVWVWVSDGHIPTILNHKMLCITNSKYWYVLNKCIINCFDMEVTIFWFKDCSRICMKIWNRCRSIINSCWGIIFYKGIIIFLQSNSSELCNHHRLKSSCLITICK